MTEAPFLVLSDICAGIVQSGIQVRLKFLATKIGSGKTPRGGAETYVDHGLLFIRSQNVHNDGVRLDDVVRIPLEVDAEMHATRVKAGDVLLNITGASIGRAAEVPPGFESANVNQHVCIIRPRRTRVGSSFLHYVLVSQIGQTQIFNAENGISREGLNFEHVGDLLIPLPGDLSRQQRIVKFLDCEIAKIDALIVKQTEFLTLLEEKFHAQTVDLLTKGVRCGVEFKSTSIEWIGQVPRHWKVSQAKHLSHIIIPQRNKPDLNTETGLPWITTEDLTGPEVCSSEKGLHVRADDAERAGARIVPADAVLSVCVGKFGIASVLRRPAIFNQQLQAYFCNSQLRPHFLRWWITISKDYFEKHATRTTVAYINRDTFAALPVLLPPILEQDEILICLNGALQKFSDAFAKANELVSVLKERRAALITAAVTGQMDVTQSKPIPVAA